MKKNLNKYRVVHTLPNNAVTVKQYAEDNGISTSYIYKQVKEGKNTKFEIVVFQTINFVLPKK